MSKKETPSNSKKESTKTPAGTVEVKDETTSAKDETVETEEEEKDKKKKEEYVPPEPDENGCYTVTKVLTGPVENFFHRMKMKFFS